MSMVAPSGTSSTDSTKRSPFAASPCVAALTATAIYDFAGAKAEKDANGPASFQVAFLDALYQATPEDVGAQPFLLETVGK